MAERGGLETQDDSGAKVAGTEGSNNFPLAPRKRKRALRTRLDASVTRLGSRANQTCKFEVEREAEEEVLGTRERMRL